MVNYLDSDGKKIEKGFYERNSCTDDRMFFKAILRGEIVYFTGQYQEETGKPIVNIKDYKIRNVSMEYDENDCRKLIPVSAEEIKSKIKKLRRNANWLEKNLKNNFPRQNSISPS